MGCLPVQFVATLYLIITTARILYPTRTLVSRLILDVMGNSSLIVRQVGLQCLKNVFFLSGL
jgi:hypothetical protein